MKQKIALLLVIIFIATVGTIAAPRAFYLSPSAQAWLDQFRINLGLDLQGGLHLEYKMDLTNVPAEKVEEAVQSVQAVVERRVNQFGVGEPIVQVAQRGLERYLIVELPGITNIEEAKQMIKETPILEFATERTAEEVETSMAPLNEQVQQSAASMLTRARDGEDFAALAEEAHNPSETQQQLVGRGVLPTAVEQIAFDSGLTDGVVYQELIDTSDSYYILRKDATEGAGEGRKVQVSYIVFPKIAPAMVPGLLYEPTELTGQYLEHANFDFNGQAVSTPVVTLTFDGVGRDLFAQMTEENIDKTIAILIDGQIISAPVVQAVITTGEAVISGDFSVDEAKDLAARLNEGALPVPITLVSQQSIGASLGGESLALGLKAGAVGLCLTIIYMIFYYRFLGIVAAGALVIYAATIVTIFKLSSGLPTMFTITLTLSGIAGLILSIGMAVDANILIFERLREELRAGKPLPRAIDEAFRRAWPSIRDGNLSTILTSFILMWFGTGFVQGFAFILVLGVLVSMFTAIVIVRLILHALAGKWLANRPWLLIGKTGQKL